MLSLGARDSMENMMVLPKKEFDRQWPRVIKLWEIEQVVNEVFSGVAQNEKTEETVW